MKIGASSLTPVSLRSLGPLPEGEGIILVVDVPLGILHLFLALFFHLRRHVVVAEVKARRPRLAERKETTIV